MNIETNVKLSQQEVISLLTHFDESSDTPLSQGLDFSSYSKKLSDFAHFVIAYEEKSMIGFIAYYLNEENHFAYIPQTVVHKNGRHKGVGHAMFSAMYDCIKSNYPAIRLEVLKVNNNARGFYAREGFVEVEDHNERLLLERKL